MFRRKTVFVVGAGASYELKLPTGEALKGKISEILNITFPDGWNQETGDRGITEILKKRSADCGQHNWNYLLHKCWLIRDALPGSLSIDNLLDAHNHDDDLVECGKLAISRAILKAERESALFQRGQSDPKTIFQRAAGSWLIPFFQILTENVPKSNIDALFANISIITFNYDRCIEEFIPAALKLYYGIDDLKAEEISSKLMVIHPYGKVGELSRRSGDNFASFGAEHYNLNAIAKQIKTFTEGLADPTLDRNIRDLCEKADQIVFLGFAFHPINMQILSTPSPSSVKKIFGTTLNLSKASSEVVEDMIIQTFQKNTVMESRMSVREEREDLDELNLDPLEAVQFLYSHFRGIA